MAAKGFIGETILCCPVGRLNTSVEVVFPVEYTFPSVEGLASVEAFGFSSVENFASVEAF